MIVQDGDVAGSGYNRVAGEPNALEQALQAAGERARGATAYLTMLPADRPDLQSLSAAGLSRIVVAMPDARLEALAETGIEVETGLMEPDARMLNRAWLTWKQTGRPLVILKWAMTLDGKIACTSGDSRWVTGDVARAHLHQIRDQVDAILIGETTAKRDDPELTARPAVPGPLPGWAGGIDPGPDEGWQPRDPLRIVLDTMARTDLNAMLFSPRLLERPMPNKTIVAATKLASPLKLKAIREKGAETLELPERGEVVALEPLLDELGRRGITSLLVEGGARVHWSFLSQGLADHIMVYVAPKVVGGAAAPGPVAGQGLEKMSQALQLIGNLRVTPIGEDVLLEGDLPK